MYVPHYCPPYKCLCFVEHTNIEMEEAHDAWRLYLSRRRAPAESTADEKRCREFYREVIRRKGFQFVWRE